MDKAEHIKYQLQTLASYEPKDLDHPVFEVAYEDESGREGFLEVCCIDLAERALDRIAELEDLERSKERVEGLQILLTTIQKDLLLRSDTDENGNDVVNLSHSIWLDLKEAVAQFNKA